MTYLHMWYPKQSGLIMGNIAPKLNYNKGVWPYNASAHEFLVGLNKLNKYILFVHNKAV